MTDFRVAYCLEARECLRRLGEQDLDDRETWANLLGAIANASVACVPDGVAQAVQSEIDSKRTVAAKRVQRRVKKALGAK